MTDAPDDIARGFLPYNKEAPQLRSRYAISPFAERHTHFRPYYPPLSSHILDIGAGTGVDAKGFAEAGYRVTAVEPADEMRALAMADNDHGNITWINDYLPSLEKVRALDIAYPFILASASFMHLNPERQAQAFEVLTGLLARDGFVAMSLRHGPVPAGRTMFDILPAPAEELAGEAGLVLALHKEGDGRKRQPGVTWSNMVFRKCGA